MRLSRKRDSSIIWPGFVDAVTTLLMVLMFVLTIFTVMQSVSQEKITSQDNELDSLTGKIQSLAEALGVERRKVSTLEAQEAQQAQLIATLTQDLRARDDAITAAQTQITAFEAQVAALALQNNEMGVKNISLEAALYSARSEIDAGVEAARLAAARREALEALIADLRKDLTDTQIVRDSAQSELTAAQEKSLTDAAALEALRARLATADDARMALSLALEAERKKAEDTLALLAASDSETAKIMETRDAALANAQRILSEEQEKSLAAARQVALLNAQIEALRSQLAGLEDILDAAREKDASAQVQLDSLGNRLNTALSQVAAEQKRRAELEAAERQRLEAENQNLTKFRSAFFSQLSQVLEGRDGVRVVGDRFVFSSEVLFNPGSAQLSAQGEAQIRGVAQILNEVKDKIPSDIDWIIRVDGHTDDTPVLPSAPYRDNWQLSQVRALSVVRFMQGALGFPPDRLAATGFGEYRPVSLGRDPASLAQNRRIELKLTER